MKEAEEFEICAEKQVHQDAVDKARSAQPDEENLADLADLFKNFSDTTRIRILYTLISGEMCVCDISEALNVTQSAVSHQLRILKQSRLVKARRDGKSVFYSLADEHVTTILFMGMDHILE